MGLIGCIADDFTGATDLAGTMVKAGMRVVQSFGDPAGIDAGDVDGLVVALKSRSIEPSEASQQSVDAAKSLLAMGADRIIFKYCSTFDSTPRGNIGPVAEALMEFLGCEQTIFCPAFPDNGRTQYAGHLFVGGKLLNESGMQNHPLNPMKDANLLRVLGQQSQRSVGLVDLATVQSGEGAIRTRLRELSDAGISLVLTDAVTAGDLELLADALHDQKLVTGGSAIAGTLPAAWRRSGVIEDAIHASELPPIDGKAVVLSGSCSQATCRQVERYAADHPARPVDLRTAVKDVATTVRDLVEWVDSQSDVPLVYTTTDVTELQAIQAEMGVTEAAELAESILSQVAEELAGRGFRKFVVAGGETSGAIVSQLGVRGIRIGQEIAPGVPWTMSVEDPRIALALKSGNFGSEDFFADALRSLATAAKA